MKLSTSMTAALLLLIGACAERAQFQPTQNVKAVSPSGHPAASYELRADRSADPQITVNVWSEGAKREDDRTTIDVSVEVRNTADQAVELDRQALALETFDTNGAPLPPAQLAHVRSEKGSLQVPPRSASAIDLRFQLAVAVAPDHVGALRFRWGVIRPSGERYVQFTEFRRQPEQIASAAAFYYDPVFGLYDPFFYGAPYGYRSYYYVPVRRVIIQPRSPRR